LRRYFAFQAFHLIQKSLKYKKCHKWYVFRGQWKRRKLYAHGYTPEYTMSCFLLEILRKVFTECLMTLEEYHAVRQELRRRVIMNYAIYESPLTTRPA
jgi:hypothetical protein